MTRSAALATAGGRRSTREADVISERATVCAAMPDVHTALAAGTRSAGHADAIARAANRLDDQERTELAARAPELVEQAASMSVDAFAGKVRDVARRLSRDEGLRHHEQLRSQRAVRRWTDRQGMCHTQFSSTPRTTPGTPPRSTPPPLPSGPSPMTVAASTNSRPTPSWRWRPPRSGVGDVRSSCWCSSTSRHCGQASTTTACAKRTTANRCHRPLCGGWPATRTSSRSRWAGGRCRTSQTPRHRRPTTSIAHHVPDVRRTRLPRPLR